MLKLINNNVKAGLSGIVAGAVRKILSFIIPRAIWPRIQQRLRLAVNYKGNIHSL